MENVILSALADQYGIERGGEVDSFVFINHATGRDISEKTLEGIDYSETQELFGCDRVRLDGCKYSIISWQGRDETGYIADNRKKIGFLHSAEKRKKINRLRLERERLSPVRYRMNYKIFPLYAVALCLLLSVFGILMRYDGERFFCIGTALLALAVVMSVVLAVKYSRIVKNEIKAEAERYDLSVSGIKPQEKYVFSSDMGVVIFDRRGMYLFGKIYSYEETETYIFSDNSFYHVNISIVFCTDTGHSVHIPLNGESIFMLEQFGIKLRNKDLLYALRYDKLETVKKIYYGKNEI